MELSLAVEKKFCGYGYLIRYLRRSVEYYYAENFYRKPDCVSTKGVRLVGM